MKTYRVTRDGEILGRYRKAGDELVLESRQARYLTPPYGRELAPVPARRRRRKKSAR